MICGTFISFPRPAVINPACLADSGSETRRVFWNEADKAVVFESGSLKAVIIPIYEY